MVGLENQNEYNFIPLNQIFGEILDFGSQVGYIALFYHFKLTLNCEPGTFERLCKD